MATNDLFLALVVATTSSGCAERTDPTQSRPMIALHVYCQTLTSDLEVAAKAYESGPVGELNPGWMGSTEKERVLALRHVERSLQLCANARPGGDPAFIDAANAISEIVIKADPSAFARELRRIAKDARAIQAIELTL